MSFLTNIAYSGRSLNKTVDGTTSAVFTCDNAPVEKSDNPITSGAAEDILSYISDTLLAVLNGTNNS